MSRGGNHGGAGRKPLLSDRQELTVGGMHAELWRRIIERQALARHDAQPEMAHVRWIQESQKKLVRRRLLTKAELDALDLRMEEALPDGPTHDLLPFSVAVEARCASIPLKRPYGPRGYARAVIIRWARRKFGVTLKPYYVKNCWEKFRKLEARIVADTALD